MLQGALLSRRIGQYAAARSRRRGLTGYNKRDTRHVQSLLECGLSGTTAKGEPASKTFHLRFASISFLIARASPRIQQRAILPGLEQMARSMPGLLTTAGRDRFTLFGLLPV